MYRRIDAKVRVSVARRAAKIDTRRAQINRELHKLDNRLEQTVKYDVNLRQINRTHTGPWLVANQFEPILALENNHRQLMRIQRGLLTRRNNLTCQLEALDNNENEGIEMLDYEEPQYHRHRNAQVEKKFLELDGLRQEIKERKKLVVKLYYASLSESKDGDQPLISVDQVIGQLNELNVPLAYLDDVESKGF